ncbi:DNA topoisomerase IB [Devosia sp. MSA67]|uniref:DNA topoisomerase n=2 Tax=Devosia sediminis TaxID=2798801 RepID=A0A934IZV1_9HYPH|nr:DNA topoisomerase IB [Devosia sediminis]
MRADEIGPAPTLAFSSDEEPGWRRRRSGTGFSYRADDGGRPDASELARIRALAIPPAWTDVWICRDACGHIQATGRDEKGRKQYRYHAGWTEHRSTTKFETLGAFARVLPGLREQVERDLRRRSLCYERVIASVVWLLDNSLIRIGNPAYARENKSFGLTTLRRKHVEVTGHRLQFQFKGKSGKEWRLQMADRRIANILKSLQDMPGQHLFKYENEGQYCSISSRDVNDYLAAFAGPEFTAKHFRTWAGTVRSFGLFADTEVPETKTAQARTMNAVIDQVAAQLGNTRTVCRQSYVHPAIPEHWQEGRLRRSGRLKPVAGLDPDEVETAAFLRRLA